MKLKSWLKGKGPGLDIGLFVFVVDFLRGNFLLDFPSFLCYNRVAFYFAGNLLLKFQIFYVLFYYNFMLKYIM
ncbi:MAG: hypothetical protein COT45_01415 [bacterium (Candidatus Stahlbacteria) CG08_land_8_20_14_0_20_40_26]|nr:MAG: hypothetical protein COX49_10000 [bacterium (Candidatus Stahlbacteria) CG23_combo_of_CG06-09_8_20_14_all_40_9]PIS25988.1 MAG: hypothetical protein COT45_01415 [bacterium (Candidatus Stahlbacteria) CG08_land_8_20_14_0_20_40_26]